MTMKAWPQPAQATARPGPPARRASACAMMCSGAADGTAHARGHRASGRSMLLEAPGGGTTTASGATGMAAGGGACGPVAGLDTLPPLVRIRPPVPRRWLPLPPRRSAWASASEKGSGTAGAGVRGGHRGAGWRGGRGRVRGGIEVHPRGLDVLGVDLARGPEERLVIARFGRRGDLVPGHAQHELVELGHLGGLAERGQAAQPPRLEVEVGVELGVGGADRGLDREVELSDLAQEGQAVHARQAGLGDHQVDLRLLLAREEGDRLLGARHQGHVVALLGEVLREEDHALGAIIDDQDVQRVAHGSQVVIPYARPGRQRQLAGQVVRLARAWRGRNIRHA